MPEHVALLRYSSNKAIYVIAVSSAVRAFPLHQPEFKSCEIHVTSSRQKFAARRPLDLGSPVFLQMSEGHTEREFPERG